MQSDCYHMNAWGCCFSVRAWFEPLYARVCAHSSFHSWLGFLPRNTQENVGKSSLWLHITPGNSNYVVVQTEVPTLTHIAPYEESASCGNKWNGIMWLFGIIRFALIALFYSHFISSVMHDYYLTLNIICCATRMSFNLKKKIKKLKKADMLWFNKLFFFSLENIRDLGFNCSQFFFI